ncbi:MAG: hypothetical protein AAFN93_09535 [Bacteroidota bacterium]
MGAIRLIEIYNYFYDAKDKEGYLLLALFLIPLFIRKISNSHISIGPFYKYVIGLFIAFFALLGPRIIYYLSGHNDWGGLLSLLFALLCGLVIPIHSKKTDQSRGFIIVTLGCLLGFLLNLNILHWIILFLSAGVYTFYNTNILDSKKLGAGLSVFIICSLLSIVTLSKVEQFDSQDTYFDKVVFSKKTRLHQVDITEWKGHHWFYYDKIKYVSTVDEWMYYEPLVHPLMHLIKNPQHVLIIGGENGCALRELTKYKGLNVDQLPFDQGLLQLAKDHPLFLNINEGIYANTSVNVIEKDIFSHLSFNTSTYDAIIVDLPDPIDLELNQFYTQEFYQLCHQSLKPSGMMVTQAGSPYFAAKAFLSIEKTMQSSNLNTLLMHNQIPSLGEWGWITGFKSSSKAEVMKSIEDLNFSDIKTTWLNEEALKILFSFGKMNVIEENVKINTLKNPVTHILYKEGDLKFN